MREQTEREPFHCERIIMEFHRKAHILDVAFEAVTISKRTLCDVTLRLDGWEFDVTPHMDVPEVVEAYRKQPAWFVEPVVSDGLAVVDESKQEVSHVAAD